MRSTTTHTRRSSRNAIHTFTLGIISCLALFLFVARDVQAQSALTIQGSISFRISKGRVLLRVGEISNTSSPSVASGKLELSLWLSKKPYDGSAPLKGSRLATCRLDGVIGGDTVANVSCGAKLRWISRGKYYVIITLSELDSSTEEFVERDFFAFSKRIKL